jgi:outer membrane cobalamin receptor
MKKAAWVLVSTVMFCAMTVNAFTQEKGVRLGEVVVTATKTEKDIQDMTQAVTVVTGEEIRKAGATDVATAIQNATNVHIGNYGTPGSVESVSIRGAYSSQVLVLLNGIRMNSSRDGGFDLSFVPVSVDDIDRIEIVRGPGSALYGSDAVGGVINIITKKPVSEQVLMKGSAGSHGYDDLYFSKYGRQGAWYYTLSGDRQTSDGYRVNSDLYQWTYGGKIGYDFSKVSSLELTANYLSKENGSPGSTVFGETPHARQQERNAVFGAAYRGKISGALDLKLSGYRKQDDLSLWDYTATDFFTGLPAPVYDRYKTTSDGGEAQVNWLIASWNQLTAGYELRHDDLDSFDAQSGSSAHTAALKAYYVQDEIAMGEALIINIGGRHDDHSAYGEKFSPKAGARYYVKSTGTTIRASYGESFRAPTFNDLYFNTSWGVGNPNLRPESAKEYEGSLEQKIGKDGRVMVAGFDRKVKDLISWDWSVYPMQVENIGRVRIRGLETEAGYGPTEAFSLKVNYTYTNPVDETTGEKIYYTIPKEQLKGSLTVMLERNVYLTAEGRGVENYVKPGEPAWRYSVFDAKISEKYSKGKGISGEFYIAVLNIFNRKYEVVQGYLMPPKEVRGGVAVTF